jgi:hypothetical protein
MSPQNVSKSNVVSTLKLYIFPTLVTILAMMIWRDVSELRSDVKALLAQSNIDKTRIDNLEADVRFLEQRVLGGKSTTQANIKPFYHDRYFKHEEFYDMEKKLVKL